MKAKIELFTIVRSYLELKEAIMKNIILRTCLVVGFALVSGVAAIAQQSQHYRAEIPFDFAAGNKVFESGSYTVRPLGVTSNSGAVAIQSNETGKGQMLGLAGMGGTSSKAEAKLVFTKWDNRYVLAEIITPTFGMKMKRTRNDARLAQNFKPETVVIILN